LSALNTLNGADSDIAISGGPEVQAHIKEGRDYHNNTSRLDYTPYVYPHPLVSRSPGSLIIGIEPEKKRLKQEPAGSYTCLERLQEPKTNGMLDNGRPCPVPTLPQKDGPTYESIYET
jgi:hypothetical protein